MLFALHWKASCSREKLCLFMGKKISLNLWWCTQGYLWHNSYMGHHQLFGLTGSLSSARKRAAPVATHCLIQIYQCSDAMLFCFQIAWWPSSFNPMSCEPRASRFWPGPALDSWKNAIGSSAFSFHKKKACVVHWPVMGARDNAVPLKLQIIIFKAHLWYTASKNIW